MKSTSNAVSNSMNPSKRTTTVTRKGHWMRFAATLVLWVIFGLGLSFLIYFFPQYPELEYKGLLRINGFTLLICTTVAFFGALVRTYSNRYLSGFRYERRFMLLTLGFSGSVMLLMTSANVILLVLSWLMMGQFMSQLIGVNRSWGEAGEARKITGKYFLISALLLGTGLAVPSYLLDTLHLHTLTNSLHLLAYPQLILTAALIVTAALIQSAIFPFHRWLLSSMTAPTPASALMHAGFVNGAGILLTLFAPLLNLSNWLTPLFIIGGLTALLAQFAKLLQISVKQRLACSTIAQMGFMIMQCGLGFFNAAVAHLVLHGFYKAYLFLSSGEGVTQTKPADDIHIRIKPLQAVFVGANALLGALIFGLMTGKGMQPDSGLFLTLIVSITVGQVTYNFIKQTQLSLGYRTIVPMALYLGSIALYAGFYNATTLILADTPMAAVAQPLNPAQVFFGILFLIGFFLMKLGYYRKHPWLYVRLLNLTQPFKATILRYKNESL